MYCSKLSCWQETKVAFCAYHQGELHVKRSGPYHAEWRFQPQLYTTKQVAILESGAQREETVDVYAIKVQFFKNDAPTFQLVKNPYHTEHDDFMLLEWFGNKLVFNDEHGCLSVFNADTGENLHTSLDTDMFITDYAMFDDRRYLYTAGWLWQPIMSREVFDVEALLSTPDYEPRSISTIDLPEWSGTRPGIHLFGFATCSELLAHHDEIVEKMSRQKRCDAFNRNREVPILLRQIAHLSDKIGKILATSRQTFFVTCRGLDSDCELRYGSTWYTWMKYPSRAIEPTDAFITQFAINTWGSDRQLPFDKIALEFTFHTDLGETRVTIEHDLTATEEKGWDGNALYRVNSEGETRIRVY
jgi:hypothetical protein